MDLAEARKTLQDLLDGKPVGARKLTDTLNWALCQIAPKFYYYACYGLFDEEETRPTAYVHQQDTVEPLNYDGSPQLPDTWPDSGPFDTEEEAWTRAYEIARREKRQS